MSIKRKKGVQKNVRCTQEHGYGFLKVESQKVTGIIKCGYGLLQGKLPSYSFLLKPSAEMRMMEKDGLVLDSIFPQPLGEMPQGEPGGERPPSGISLAVLCLFLLDKHPPVLYVEGL